MVWQLLERLIAVAQSIAQQAREPLLNLWHAVRGAIMFVAQILAALILLFEEWGWRPLVDALERLSRFKIWRQLEVFIAGLPPYAALAALALPTTLLLPLKFLSIYLLANGHFFTAGALFVFAKIASTALIARVFLLTKPALMRIAWFQRGYDWLIPWKEALFASIRASWPWRYGRMMKTRATHETKQAWMRWSPALTERWRQLRAQLVEAWHKQKPALTAALQSLRERVRRLILPG